MWRDGSPDEVPNDWERAFPPGEPAWSWDEATQAWVLHLFAPEQPDLNWDHPDVRPAMLDTLRFWLDRGVDGFRMDVIHLIGKGADLPELTPDEAKVPTAMIDVPSGRVRMLPPTASGALRLIETTSNSARGVCADRLGTMANATRNSAATRGMAARFYAPASISATTGK